MLAAAVVGPIHPSLYRCTCRFLFCTLAWELRLDLGFVDIGLVGFGWASWVGCSFGWLFVCWLGEYNGMGQDEMGGEDKELPFKTAGCV